MDNNDRCVNSNGSQNSNIILQAAKCPNCHGSLNLSELKDIIKCAYCGSDIIVNEAAKKNAANISKTENIPVQDANAKKSLRPFVIIGLLVCLTAGVLYFFERDKSKISDINPPGKAEIKSPYNGRWSVIKPTGIAINSLQKCVYVSEKEKNLVKKFDLDGNFITQWGGTGTGDGQFNEPYGIAVDASGNVYVTDYFNDRIQKFDPNGKFILKFGGPGNGDGQFSRPIWIAIDINKNSIYVMDRTNGRIQKFDPDGKFILKWGNPGSENGQFSSPSMIAADSGGYIYVADVYNHRIQKFDPNGNFIAKIGNKGSGDGQFNLPCGVAADADNNLYVADSFNHRIQKFDSKGNYIAKLGKNGGDGSYGKGIGEFSNPHGIATDTYGYFYVTDHNNDRIQKLKLN